MAEDDTTKLVIYGLGLATVFFFIYLAYKEYRHPPDIGSMYQNQTNIQVLEQRLIQIENKLDEFQKSLDSKPLRENTERKSVSMNSFNKVNRLTKAQEQKLTRETFGML